MLRGPRRGAGGSPCRPSSASPASQQRARQAVGPAGRGPSEGGGCAGGPSATALRRNPPGIPSSCQNQRVRTNPRARRSPSLVRPVAESGQRGRGGGALGSRHGPPQASRRPVGPPAPPAGLRSRRRPFGRQPRPAPRDGPASPPLESLPWAPPEPASRPRQRRPGRRVHLRRHEVPPPHPLPRAQGPGLAVRRRTAHTLALPSESRIPCWLAPKRANGRFNSPK